MCLSGMGKGQNSGDDPTEKRCKRFFRRHLSAPGGTSTTINESESENEFEEKVEVAQTRCQSDESYLGYAFENDQSLNVKFTLPLIGIL